MAKQPLAVETDRSSELRHELRKQGYTEQWEVRENVTRVSYWHNGAGKSILVLEHANRSVKGGGYEWNGWDIYRQLCPENNTARTYEALHNFTTGSSIV